MFCYFWAASSKRTFLTKVLSGKVRSKSCPLPPAAAEGLQVHFSMGASIMPRKQPMIVPESCSEDASKSKPSQSEKNPACTWRFDRRLLVGFAAGFWAWLVDFGGVVRRRSFCFRLADFPTDFFLADSSFVFVTKKPTTKIHRKIHHFHGSLLEDFPR